MKETKQEFNELMARVIQHEIDHLYGKLLIDYLDKDVLKTFKKKLNEIKKGKINTEYPLHIYNDNFHGY
jgi:peptide deformylase